MLKLKYYYLIIFKRKSSLILRALLFLTEIYAELKTATIEFVLLSWYCLIAALIFSAGYYSAPIFLQFKEFELYWGAVLRLEEEYWRSLFLITFIGVIFEAGNETREKIWSDFGAEQKWREERKESGFCSCRCFWESEKLMCEKIFSKRAKFFCSRAAL